MLGIATASLFLLAGRVHFALGQNSSVHSLNVSSCPGYTLQSVQNTSTGFTASLALAGPACNAFGTDIANLTLEVSYDSESRLHVHIFDTSDQQFQVPDSVITRPSVSNSSNTTESDLEFHYNSSPFEFWITRRSDSAALAPLFDTRSSSLPPTPISALNSSDSSTAFPNFGLVFEDQYLQLTSALPLDANIYGLGEAVASSGFRRNVGAGNNSTGIGTVQTMWARDVADPIDENMYGMHALYLDHRYNETSGAAASHGVFLLNSAGADIVLATPPLANTSLVQYRYIGGTLDLYFLSGPTPKEVVEQYAEVVGLPTWQPYWGFGFHLCRWGYANISETREQVQRMREANIPLEVMWNDIDLYHAVRDFTTDPVSFPTEEVRNFTRELATNNQHYIPIVDAALPKRVNETDLYEPYTSGAAQGVFITNPDGSEYVGQVWPGYTVFPDFFANNTQAWWTEVFKNWSATGGVEFSGIWLDMNEPSSFCEGSCGSNTSIANTSVPFILPGRPGNLVSDYPEGYEQAVSGPSGNITVNGTLTYGAGEENNTALVRLAKRGLGAAGQSGVDLNTPPYTIHNGFGKLAIHTIATNATSAAGYVQLDTHNLFGLMEEKATHLALLDIIPGKRPFLISRSTFPSSGKWTGHWLGDNFSKWQYMSFSIQGILQFQLFQIPMVGADTCGFNGNTDEELCNRWMQLSAFTPFYRNHNIMGAISQEPYRWDSVANASRTAIAIRYSLLPYWYTLFANSSIYGTPPVRALFWEFSDEPELFAADRQFLVGRDILVTPVLEPNVSSVDGIFPGRGNVTWRDWYTHEAVNASSGTNTTLSAPLGHINVHIRDGAVLLLHAEPAYTTTETRAGPFALLATLPSSTRGRNSTAFGTAYIDDGISFPPGPNTTLIFQASTSSSGGSLISTPLGSFNITQKLTQVTVLGVPVAPTNVTLQGASLGNGTWTFNATKGELVVSGNGVEADLNSPLSLTWA